MSEGTTDIAIIGMACRVPGAATVDEFWRNLRDGVESVRRYTLEELREAGVSSTLLADPRYVPAGAPLEHMESFDAEFFGMSAHEAAVMDPQHRQMLECAWEALEDAGHPPRSFRGPVGIFAGSGHNAYLPYNLLSRPELVESDGFFLLRHTGNDKDFLTTRVSYVFDLHGPSVAVQTACSTSLVAVHLAVQSLLAGECDLALAGGVTIELPHRQGYLHAEGEILSPDGRCRPFDANASGTVFGSGVGVVVLRRLADAIADGDTIHAVVKGTAVNNDGSGKVSYLAPSVAGQASAIAEALAVSGVDAATIGYLEAHGTGTLVGDPIEVIALTEAFRQHTQARGYCGIGSVKSNIGHLDTAAGVVSLIKAVQAIRHRQLPPSLNYAQANPACRFEESPFFVNAELREWAGDQPRRAGVSSLGVGGTNAHVIIEEWREPARAARASTQPEVLLLSARSLEALELAGEKLVSHLRKTDAPLEDIAWTLQAGREAMPFRRIVAAGSREEAIERLTARDPRLVFESRAPDRSTSVAFMFAGGGTQYPGMGEELYRTEPVYRAAIDDCLGLLEPWHAQQVRSALFPVAGAQAEAARLLEQPSLGLPALFMTQWAQSQLWQEWGIEPSALIGHSMGEYTAACLAGVFSLQDALALVTIRARLFETVKPGAMLSVPLSARELEPLLDADLSIAAINAPSLCVASGTLSAVDRLERLLTARGLETSRLRISVAAHSALLAPILSEFHAFVRRLELRAPRIPVASNLSGTWLSDAEATDPDYWVRHLRQTVRFADGIRTLVGDGSRVLLEIGPGRTLATLARQQEAPGGVAPPVTLPSMAPHGELAPDGTFMRTMLGRLWIAGVNVPWERLHQQRPRRVPLPTYPFTRARHWIEPGSTAPAPIAQGTTSLERTRDLSQWFSQPSWRRAPAAPGPALDGPVLLLAEPSRLAGRLMKRLQAGGVDAIHARRGGAFAESGRDGYTVPAGGPEGLVRLFAALRDRGRMPRHIVYIPGSSGGKLQDILLPLLALGQAIGSEEISNLSLVVLTAGGARIAGESELDPAQGALAGAVRVIPAELPGVSARTIDLAPGDVAPSTIDRLVAELGVESAGIVALRGPDRWVPSLEPWPLPPTSLPGFHEEGAYLITGGFGGLGLAVARHLAERHHARLTLLGRIALPPRDTWDAWLADHAEGDEVSRRIGLVRDLEALGARVHAVTADVTDPRAFRQAVEESRRWFGVLNGVIHAAGVLDDGALQVRDEAMALKVLGPKVQGTMALEHAVQGIHLDFIVLFSSISAFAGLPGQFDYAAANAFLDAWAQQRAGSDGARVVSIDWAPWADVGAAARLAETMGVASPFQGEPTNHPVLTRRLALGAREQAYVGRLDAGTDWILNEHRVRGGQPMLPGTAFLALAHLPDYLARAGGRRNGDEPAANALALRDIEFLDPLIVPEGARTEIRVRRDIAEGRLAIESRADASEPWHLHARARMGVVTGPAPVIDLPQLRSRCVREVSAAAVSTEAPHLAFGPRWDNVKRISVAQREAMLELELAPRFASDLAVYPLHPALMDMALAGAQALVPWLDRESQVLVPLAVQSVRVWDALPRQVISRVRYREDLSTPGDVAVFDAAVCDLAGRVLVEATELSLLAVRDTARLAVAPPRGEGRAAQRAPANPLLALTIREGIRASEGGEALERIMASSPPPQVAVSPLPLGRLLSEFEALRTAAPRVRERGTDMNPEEVRTPLEREVGDIVASLLSMSRVGLDENLIDLGLHSLLAVRLFTRLKKATGQNLPLATVLEAPTIRTLAARFGDVTVARREGDEQADILESSNAVRDPRAHEDWLRPLWSHVVPLKPGGTLPPFFSIHARGGAVLNYRTLTTFVDPEQPLYGIQCRGLDGRTEPFRSIEEMTVQYLEEIRRIQPHGPYFLGGGSLGGVVALEIARRLKEEGEPIGLIAMFDSWGPVWFSPDHKAGGGGGRLWRKLNAHVERLRRQGAMSGTQLLLHGLERRFTTRRRLMTAQLLRKAGIELPHDLRYFYVEHLNLAALQRFSPQPYDGNIVLFRALDDPDADFSDPTMGWRGSVQGQIEIIDAPGTHNSIVHDAVFGELFRQRLRKAQEEAKPEEAVK